jgi:hypothetical protein
MQALGVVLATMILIALLASGYHRQPATLLLQIFESFLKNINTLSKGISHGQLDESAIFI